MTRVAHLAVKPETPGEPGLPKRQVSRLRVTLAGAAGDFNRYRTRELAGDPDSAILLLTREVMDGLRRDGWPVAPGDLGENLLLDGVAEERLGPGTRLRAGEVELEVSRACDPCTELYALPYVGPGRGPAFLRALAGRRGWYARVLREGEILPGDPCELLDPGGG